MNHGPSVSTGCPQPEHVVPTDRLVSLNYQQKITFDSLDNQVWPSGSRLLYMKTMMLYNLGLTKSSVKFMDNKNQSGGNGILIYVKCNIAL